jgi:fibrillarin-like rRNA methylase
LDVSKLTDDKVKDMISNSQNRQKTIGMLLDANVPLTYSNVKNLLLYSRNTQPTIDTLLNKNIDLTDKNMSSLIWSYCDDNQQRKGYNDLIVKQLGALKLKQQLSETKFKYRDFYSYLK